MTDGANLGARPGSGRLAGKTAIVVGAGQSAGETMGNGRATALLFAREGARLLLVDRDEATVTETRERIVAAGGDAEVHVADITSEEQCAGLAAAGRAHLGRIDVLHNNVGIGAGDSYPSKLEAEVWDRILDVNLRAMWLTCKHVLPIMREQGSGSIVNISSLAAIGGAPRLTAYKVSKAGVNALTQTMAVAHAAHGIRVNAIAPGLIDTPMAVDSAAQTMGRSREDLAAARAKRVPTGRQGSAWDVAYAALYLASDESQFVSGIVLPVDGGQGALVG
jgi:NAD(P)-dependent dehydrogenase (short-subunit alcohol dehydrogenase family)